MRSKLIHAKMIFMLLFITACEPPHNVYQGDIYGLHYKAKKQYFVNSGKAVSLEGQNQLLLITVDTLRVMRNDTTILMVPGIKQNYAMGSKKDGIMVFEASTPQGIKSFRIELGENYRKHAESTPLTIGQVMNGPYDISLDTIRTVYDASFAK